MPATSYLQMIIAKIMVLTDTALEMFAKTGGSSTSFINVDATSCGITQMTANTTACGVTLISSLDTLIVQGVNLLSGMINALGAIPMS